VGGWLTVIASGLVGVALSFRGRKGGGTVPAITDGMSGLLRLFLLPTLFLIASIFVLRLATARGSFIMYFVAAVLLGMGIGAYLRAWKRPPDE
jgi:hypothetical protein